MKTKNVIFSCTFQTRIKLLIWTDDFYDKFLSNLSSMQAQIIQEKQLVAKDQIKMFSFGLKVALLQKLNDVSTSSQRRHA